MKAGFVLVRVCMLERKTLAPGKENVSGRLTMFSSVFTHLTSPCHYVNTSFTIRLCDQIRLPAGTISDLVRPAGEAVRVSEAAAAGVEHQRLLELAAAEAGLGEDQQGGGVAGPHLHYMLFLLPLHLYTCTPPAAPAPPPAAPAGTVLLPEILQPAITGFGSSSRLGLV